MAHFDAVVRHACHRLSNLPAQDHAAEPASLDDTAGRGTSGYLY